MIKQFYMQLREESQHTGGISIAVRHIESLVRMSIGKLFHLFSPCQDAPALRGQKRRCRHGDPCDATIFHSDTETQHFQIDYEEIPPIRLKSDVA
jgi:hypothetical protein